MLFTKNIYGADNESELSEKSNISTLFSKVIGANSATVYNEALEGFRRSLSSRTLSEKEKLTLSSIMSKMTFNSSTMSFYYNYILAAYSTNHSMVYDLPTIFEKNEKNNLIEVLQILKEANLFKTAPGFYEMTLEDKLAQLMSFKCVRFTMNMPVSLLSVFLGVTEKEILAVVAKIPLTKVGDFGRASYSIRGNFEAARNINNTDWNKFELVDANGTYYVKQTVVFPISE